MIDAIHVAGAALRANQQWLDSISANVANINTPAYKATDTQFHAAVQAGNVSAALVEARVQISDPTTGDIRQTGRELDLAINGQGFFRVMNTDGQIAFTRLGRFVVNAEGALATENGWVLAENTRIPPDALAVEISPQGEVRVKLPDQVALMNAGNIPLAQLTDLSSLTEISAGIYRENGGISAVDDVKPGGGNAGSLQQGHLEFSNVDLVNEMSQLVIAQRAYQLNARVLQISDQALETINNLRR